MRPSTWLFALTYSRLDLIYANTYDIRDKLCQPRLGEICVVFYRFWAENLSLLRGAFAQILVFLWFLVFYVRSPCEIYGQTRRVRWYSAAYVSQTRDWKHFAVSEVAADWHELMIPPRIRLCQYTMLAVCELPRPQLHNASMLYLWNIII